MSETYNLTEAAKATGMTRNRLEEIAKKAGQTIDFGISADLMDRIVQEQTMYISFREFAAVPRGEKYAGSTYSKSKLLDELELNKFFGVELIEPEDLLTGRTSDEVFFRRSDIPALENHLRQFFGLYALPEEDKVEHILAAADQVNTKACLRKYMESCLFEETVKPSFTEFVSLVLTLPDLPKIEDKHIMQLLTVPMSVSAKSTLVNFLNYARYHTKKVRYNRLSQKPKESQPIPAYTDETYLFLARFIFNAEYIHEHQMIERALENHLFIEMWLYLALHFCCGWRAADICNGWKYLRLHEKPNNTYGINQETLYDDLLNDKIPDEIYEDVCRYAMQSVAVSGQKPSKTADTDAPPLVISIDPVLTTFFGLLTLISEAVMIRTGDGYMKDNRESQYQKRQIYRDFFGQEMYDVLGGRNIQSRRLNKCYLQGIEETARQTGCGSLMASALASFARSHTNLDTIAHYLKDHQLNAENAEMVLYFMMERGVFGFEAYQTLLTAYPEAIKALPMKKQNEVMALIANSPLQIELEQSGIAAKYELQDSFERNEREDVLSTLESMYEISQGHAKGKDEGIHCICRAKGYPCLHPEFSSCLANACPYLVFTRYGYKALLEIIWEYKQAENEGDLKMSAALREVIMPRFREIINTLMRDMNMRKEEKSAMKLMLTEVLENGS